MSSPPSPTSDDDQQQPAPSPPLLPPLPTKTALELRARCWRRRRLYREFATRYLNNELLENVLHSRGTWVGDARDDWQAAAAPTLAAATPPACSITLSPFRVESSTASSSGNGTASSLFRPKQAHRDDSYQRRYLTPNGSGALCTSHPT
ncbi:hypothetical protein EXIGLDRAFT_766914 [Exidia glandulosa HHB12029]|uniref:Uncharacterized protein n=1 Tax=Exidia glandulosa HHB12029 TaxID=1314781 RepID=A0A165JBZ0_EXIGL|nr:hypothetical protein EXIGLDRAFT_766914 [Exidia glandulosa HHB12029]